MSAGQEQQGSGRRFLQQKNFRLDPSKLKKKKSIMQTSTPKRCSLRAAQQQETRFLVLECTFRALQYCNMTDSELVQLVTTGSIQFTNCATAISAWSVSTSSTKDAPYETRAERKDK